MLNQHVDFTRKVVFDSNNSLKINSGYSYWLPSSPRNTQQSNQQSILEESIIWKKPKQSSEDEQEEQINPITNEQINQISSKPLEFKEETMINRKITYQNQQQHKSEIVGFKHTQSCSEEIIYEKNPQARKRKKQLEKKLKISFEDSNQSSLQTVSQHDFKKKELKTVVSKLKNLQILNQKIQSQLEHQTEGIVWHVMKSILLLGLFKMPHKVSEIDSLPNTHLISAQGKVKKKSSQEKTVSIPSLSCKGKSREKIFSSKFPAFQIPEYPYSCEEHQLKKIAKTIFKDFQYNADHLTVEKKHRTSEKMIIKNIKSSITIEWSRNGEFYIGPFDAVVGKSGCGFEDMPNKFKYIGSFKNNKKHGIGIMRTQNSKDLESFDPQNLDNFNYKKQKARK